MSALNQLLGSSSRNGNGKKDWSQSDIKLALGMKMAGASRKDIATASGHPLNSVTYLFSVKLNGKFNTVEEILTYLGVQSKEELVAFATKELERRAGSPTPIEQEIEQEETEEQAS